MPSIVSRKWRKIVWTTLIAGTASKAPVIWKKCSPTIRENTTSTGWIFAVSPMIFGFRKFASIWWIPMIHASTAIAVPGDWVSPIATAGIAETIDPKIGTIEPRAARIAMIGQYFRPNIQNPIAAKTPFITQMMSCPRTTPASPRSSRLRKRSNDAWDSSPARLRKKSMIFSWVSMM